jgi:hypothetical protein
MPDLAAVDRRLRDTLAPYRDRFSVHESEQGLMLEIPGQEGQTWGFVAGTRLNKHYVSYYLMGVYAQPELLDSVSPELRRRMQGKSCFNFTKVDETLLGELQQLTSRSIEGYTERVGVLERRAKQLRASSRSARAGRGGGAANGRH